VRASAPRRAEGEDLNRYKIAKQADTVMLFFLFPRARPRRLFERLGLPMVRP
jgi:trehalose/maltose hydrolase-like predicted phosphorylase